MILLLIQAVSAAKLKFEHINPLFSDGCVDRFDAVLSENDQEYALKYKLNQLMPYDDFTCFYYDLDGSGTLSLDSENRQVSGTFSGSGLFVFNGTNYGSSHTSVDMKKAVYDSPGACEGAETPASKAKTKHRNRRGAGEKTYLELVFVVSSEIWQSFDQDNKKVRKHFKEVYNIMAEHYRQVRINLLLLDVMITTEDPFDLVKENHGKNLELFSDWRKKPRKGSSSAKRFDRADSIIHFIPRNKFKGSTIGLAYTDVMCNPWSVAIVAADQNNAAAVAATASHELGHNYGMHHDKENDPDTSCECSDGSHKCIMSAIISNDTPSKWSTCSREVLESMQDEVSHSCLKDQPSADLLFGNPVCGNGIIEKGEQCDCGSHDCNCCTSECKLPEGAECSPTNGKCCDDNCKVKRKGSLCRQAESDCDLAEYCDGESVFCPRNDFKHTGATCASGHGHCYGPECRHKDGQCREMFGMSSTSSSKCMNHYNTIPFNQFGGCGASMSQCSEENAVCGKQYCTGGDAKRGKWTNFFEMTRRYEETECRSLHEWTRMTKTAKNISLIDEAEPGMVQNGVPCSEGHFCILGSCEPITDYYECPDCSGHGICSNHNECKCDCGWTGENCSQVAWCEENFRLALFIIVVSFVGILLILLLVYLICVFSCGKKWNFCCKKSTSGTGQSVQKHTDNRCEIQLPVYEQKKQMKVRDGSYDFDEVKEKLLGNSSPPTVKPAVNTYRSEETSKKSLKNKGYEDHQIKFQGKSPPKLPQPTVERIGATEFQNLLRESAISGEFNVQSSYR